MKTIGVVFILLLAQVAYGQKVKTEIIKTSAECSMCKDRVEEKLNYTKGIVFAELNYESKELEVRYKTKNISVEKIRAILNELGYDADETKAVPEAQKALPDCCQPGGMAKEIHN
jgi:periplasmic mercuric ion binding protein